MYADAFCRFQNPMENTRSSEPRVLHTRATHIHREGGRIFVARVAGVNTRERCLAVHLTLDTAVPNSESFIYLIWKSHSARTRELGFGVIRLHLRNMKIALDGKHAYPRIGQSDLALKRAPETRSNT